MSPDSRTDDLATTGLALGSRTRVYGSVVGIGLAILVLGLIVPFVVADPERTALVDAAAPTTTYDFTGGGDGPTRPNTSGAVAGPGDTGEETTGAMSPGSGTAVGSTATSPGAAPGPTVPLTASDIGVTPETVKLGVLVPRSELAGIDVSEYTGDIPGLWRAYVDEVNETTGVGGRRIEPVLVDYDGLSQDDMRAACVALTEDAKVFAVVNAGGYYGDPILCVTEQHATPAILQSSEIRDFYARSAGRFISIGMEKERTLINWARRSFADGRFDGHKIGVLDREGVDKVAVDQALVPEMERLGVPITHRSTISADFAVAQNQIQLEVQEMQRKGVTLVFFATGFTHAAVFAQNAESQGWRPQYSGSDFAGATLDTYAAAMPPSFAGAYGYTSLRTGESRVGLDEAANDARCREIAERRLNKEIARDSGEYVTGATACGILDLFVRGFLAAGPNPTQVSFTGAMAAIGAFDGPYTGASSFAPGKTDAPDVIRSVSFDGGCRCWMPTGPFLRAEV